MIRRTALAWHWLVALLPAVLRVDARERWRAALGAGLGIALTGLATRWVAVHLGMNPWLVAPLGASAVLVFAVPASPLAQPWSVIGGNTLSALVGMACVHLVPDAGLAAGLAVGAAIALMFLLRCLHPPGGASALLVVLMQVSDARFALLPVLLNSTLLVLAGAFYNSLTGRRYPHVQVAVAAAPQADVPGPAAPAGSRFTAADLDAALAHYNQVLDVSRDDLEGLLHEAEASAYQRNLGALRCADVMSPNPVVARAEMPMMAAWALMRAHSIKALPVIDQSRRIVGIVTLADFVRHMMASGVNARAPGVIPADRRIGEIMTRRVRVASAQVHVIELLPLFSEGGHHHIPIVDEEKTLVGIITQSDLVRALHRAVRPA